MMHGNPNAWEWLVLPNGQTSLQAVRFEWTHPPLAKLGMILGMELFGENSFGWRIPGAILGTLTVYLVFLLGKVIFDDEKIGLLAAFVFALDGLPLVMSRIGLNDSYFLFFALLSIYLLIIKRDFWSAVALGLSIASKWSGIWTIPILVAIFLRRNFKEQVFNTSILWFLILPFIIYLLSYLPMFLNGHTFSYWWELQKQMLIFHRSQTLTHPYSSDWWSWPILLRPIVFYKIGEPTDIVGKIYAMGNPFVFWFGLISVIIGTVYYFIENNTKNIGLVIFSYLIFFVPWAFSPRLMFIYHYLPAVPFLAIATAYILRRFPKITFIYLFICLFVYLYFYPHWTGLQVPVWLDNSYYWIKSWR